MKTIGFWQGIKKLLFQQLNTEIEGYGYHYHFKSYILSMLLFLIAVWIVGYFYLLNPLCMGILVITGFVVFPFIVKSQFYHMYNNQRFENLMNYMEKMIIFFKQDPKILSCLEKSRDYVDTTTKEKIDVAILILKEDMSVDRYDKALGFIEDEYHSARLVSLHRFMKTVEEKSSRDYRVSLNHLDYDLKSWVNRIYQYQTELKLKKTQILISLFASLALLAIFSVMWIKVDDMTHMVSHPLYQIGALFFLVVELCLLTVVQLKINGQWLIEDYQQIHNEKMMKKVKNIHDYQYKSCLMKQKKKLIFFIVFMIYGIYRSQMLIVVLSIVILLYLLYEPHYMYKLQKKSISRMISQEFPLWLMDVALNLNNYVVIGAISHSMSFVSPVFRYYLQNFLDDVEKQPTSIEPFSQFLQEYHMRDVHTSMLALYSLQEVDQSDGEREVGELVKRNQTMLADGEKLRNQQALIGVLMISFVPILFTMIKIMGDMLIMLTGIFSYIR